MKTHTLGAGQLVEYILSRERNKTLIDDVNCRNTNFCEEMSGNCNLSNCKVIHKKTFLRLK